MADRIIYLVAKVTAAMQGGDLEFVDDARLGVLLSHGWETSTTLPDRKVTSGGKSFMATMIVLKNAADNRGVAVRGQDRHGGKELVDTTDEFGNTQRVEPGKMLVRVMERLSNGLANLGDSGHLGSARNHSMPGLTIISGETVQKAWDCGALAARRGEPASACPFPVPSHAASQWLSGYRGGNSAQSVTNGAADSAFRSGEASARQYAEDDEVSCPFPPGSPLRESWLRGFRNGGGRVE